MMSSPIRLRDYKKDFMLNSAEYEISNAYNTGKKFSFFRLR